MATHGQQISGPDRSGLENQNRLHRKLPTINEDVYMCENESSEGYPMCKDDGACELDRDVAEQDDVNLIVLSIPDEE